jgi:uncharacterized protein YaaR (DUF327 family)
MKWPFVKRKTLERAKEETFQALSEAARAIRSREAMQKQVQDAGKQLDQWAKNSTCGFFDQIVPSRVESAIRPERQTFAVVYEADVGMLRNLDPKYDGVIELIADKLHQDIMEAVRHEFRRVNPN